MQPNNNSIQKSDAQPNAKEGALTSIIQITKCEVHLVQHHDDNKDRLHKNLTRKRNRKTVAASEIEFKI